MPELPEVETVRRTLNKIALGRTIRTVEVRWPNIIRRPQQITDFCRLLIGETLQKVDRRGKFLLLRFDDKTLVSHLRMEGRYQLAREGDPVDKYTHVIFYFTDHSMLEYRDVRKFGTMHLFDTGEEIRQLPLNKLGPEPLSAAFTAKILRASCGKTARPIKQLLLDQTVIAGLGNIYADETLFRAGIHPLTPANVLKPAQADCLYRSIKEILAEAVDMGGSTIRTFVNSQGITGLFQQNLRVYGRPGQPCYQCGTLIKKIKVGGRGTHFCPHCQRRESGIC